MFDPQKTYSYSIYVVDNILISLKLKVGAEEII